MAICDVVAVRSGPERGEGATRTSTLSPLSAAAADLNSIPVSVATTVHREPAGYLLAGMRADGRDLCFQRRQTSYRTARNNSIGGKSPRALPGNARIEPTKQSLRGLANGLQPNLSFANAPELHGHLSKGADAACAKKLSNRSMS